MQPFLDLYLGSSDSTKHHLLYQIQRHMSQIDGNLRFDFRKYSGLQDISAHLFR